MQQQLNEKLSMLIDDQLESRQACELLKTMSDDVQLQAKARRYHLISQAIKNDGYLTAEDGFARQLHHRLRDEPIYLLPKKSRTNLDWQKTLGLAAAASMAMVAVLVFSQSEKQTQLLDRGNSMAMAHAPTTDHAKFKEYLQAHDNTWYVNNKAGVQQYTRLAGYQK